MLQSLADMAGAPVDPFSFASARELNLPRSGTAGLGMEVSADRVAFVISYDVTGFDLLAGQAGTSTMTVFFVTGILAAVALPVYQDYIARSQVMEAIAMAGAVKTVISEFQASTGELPDSLDELGGGMSGRYAELSWNDGVLVVQMHERAPVNDRVRGHTIGLGLTDGGSWVCGNADDSAGELLGAAPSDYTSLPEKYLPNACR
jgi:type IV pilus assembly protein PilA